MACNLHHIALQIGATGDARFGDGADGDNEVPDIPHC